ncbi:MAG: diaminopimelate decarboxylase family protein [Bilifractor sp.]|jgi:diaminopimelate decarboxylase
MDNTIIKVLKDQAAVTDSPFYLFDLDAFRENIRRIRRETGDAAKLCFAMKCNPFLMPQAAPEVDRIEVCSYGEYCICRKDGIDPGKLLISGVLKKPSELERMVEECGSRAGYTVESMGQFALLADLAKKRREKLRIYIRLTSGNQFGLDWESVNTVFELAGMTPYLEIAGIHYYSGSQKKKAAKPVRELEKLDQLLLELQDRFHVTIPELEYGPGIPARYFEDQPENLDESFFEEIRKAIAAMTWKGHVTMEMGRIFASSCGYYVTRVCDIKHSGETAYAITDGGMHQLNYDGQIRGMYHPFVTVLTETEKRRENNTQTPLEMDGSSHNCNWTVCGCLCTANDVMCVEQDLGPLKVGDILAFGNVGAYSMVEGMALFLSHELPAIFSYARDEGSKCLRQPRECWELNS